jgi:hypothetical protein
MRSTTAAEPASENALFSGRDHGVGGAAAFVVDGAVDLDQGGMAAQRFDVGSGEVEVEIGPDREKCQQQEGNLKKMPQRRAARCSRTVANTSFRGFRAPSWRLAGGGCRVVVRVLILVPVVFAHKCLFVLLWRLEMSVRLPVDRRRRFAHGDRPQLAAPARAAGAEPVSGT